MSAHSHSCRWPALVVAMLGCALCATPALAADPLRVAVMPLEVSGADPGDGAPVLAAIREEAEADPALADVGAIAMQVDEARLTFSCFDESPGCMTQVAQTLGADRLAWGKLTRQGQRWTLELTVLEVSSVEARRETFREEGAPAMQIISEAAAAFVAGRDPVAKTPVVVRSDPSGAEVYVDGTAAGRTPARLRLPQGRRTIELRMQGMQPAIREVDVGADALAINESLSSDGSAPAGVVDARRDRGRDDGLGTGFWLGVSSAAVTVGAAAAATAFALQTETAKEDGENATTTAEYETAKDDFESAQLMTNVMWGVTAVGAAATTYFFFFYDDGDSGVAVAPTPTGMGIAGRF